MLTYWVGRKAHSGFSMRCFEITNILANTYKKRMPWREITQSSLTLCDPMDCSLPGSSIHGNFQSTEVGCHFLLKGIFPTQGSNPGLPHCRQTLYCLSHQGSLMIQVKNWIKNNGKGVWEGRVVGRWMGGEGSVRWGPAGQRSSFSFPVHPRWEGHPTALSQLIQSSATRSHQSAAPSGATALPEAEALGRVLRVALDHQFLRLLTLPWLRIHIRQNWSDVKGRSLGPVLLFATSRTIQSKESSRPEYWGG